MTPPPAAPRSSPRPVPRLRAEPDPASAEGTAGSASVYNPAAVVKDDKVVLLYRAHADDIVSVGLATSDDGIHFERHPEPVISPSEPYEVHGCEDPRVTEIDGTYYLTYTAYDGTCGLLCPGHLDRPVHVDQARPMFPDPNTFLPQGNGMDGPWSKAGRILPVPIDGRYLMYFGEGSIWYAWSEDLIHWTPCSNDEPIMTPTPPGTFGSTSRGRPAADHHRQRADPAAAQRGGEERGWVRALRADSCSSTPTSRRRSWRR